MKKKPKNLINFSISHHIRIKKEKNRRKNGKKMFQKFCECPEKKKKFVKTEKKLKMPFRNKNIGVDFLTKTNF